MMMTIIIVADRYVCAYIYKNINMLTVTLVQVQLELNFENQVMSELSTILDLRLLGKMWRGTRDEQTPQPLRMILGNKGAVHLLSLSFPPVVSRWPF